MLVTTNISITPRGARELARQRDRFRPRCPGEVMGFSYLASATEPDGTTSPGFVPGYFRDSISTDELDDSWVLAKFPDGTEICFMPRFKWRPDEQYILDVASEAYETFSIGPAPRG